MQSVAKKYGITLESAGGVIKHINGVFKLKVNVEGSIEEAYRKNWKPHELPEDGLGRTFVAGGRTYTIKGFDPYKTFEVLTVRDDGVTICHKSFAVKEYFQKLSATSTPVTTAA